MFLSDAFELAQKGNVEVQILLGDWYLNGENGVKEDNDEAFNWYQEAAKSNNPLALGKLGEMYQYGFGVEGNDEKAKFYYKKGIDLNDAHCKFRYAWLIEREGNNKDALKYYKEAALQGHENAMGMVQMYEMGLRGR